MCAREDRAWCCECWEAEDSSCRAAEASNARRLSDGAAWVDLQTDTEAVDGDQVV